MHLLVRARAQTLRHGTHAHAQFNTHSHTSCVHAHILSRLWDWWGTRKNKTDAQVHGHCKTLDKRHNLRFRERSGLFNSSVKLVWSIYTETGTNAGQRQGWCPTRTGGREHTGRPDAQPCTAPNRQVSTSTQTPELRCALGPLQGATPPHQSLQTSPGHTCTHLSAAAPLSSVPHSRHSLRPESPGPGQPPPAAHREGPSRPGGGRLGPAGPGGALTGLPKVGAGKPRLLRSKQSGGGRTPHVGFRFPGNQVRVCVSAPSGSDAGPMASGQHKGALRGAAMQGPCPLRVDQGW